MSFHAVENVSQTTLEGGCNCGEIRYRLDNQPMIVQCCHCTWCQRETASAFIISAPIETSLLHVTRGVPTTQKIPTASGAGQILYRCGTCSVILFSQYGDANPLTRLVRASTIDRISTTGHDGVVNSTKSIRGLAPDVHIYVTTKQDWVVIPTGLPTYDAFYVREECWSKESLARYDDVRKEVEKEI